MRRYLQYIISCVSVLSLLFVTTSCEHKDLCYHHPHTKTLKVVFNWENAPNANPKGMCVYFYPFEGGSGYRFDFNNLNGGQISLPVGKYRVLTYNNDTEAQTFRNMDNYSLHNVTTRLGSVLEPLYGNAMQHAPRSEGTEDESVYITPDMMWGCNVMEVEVTDDGLNYIHITIEGSGLTSPLPVFNKEYIITLYPHELLCTYTYEVRNVKNLKHVQQMSGTLSGMSPMLTFSNEEIGREPVTIPFEAYSNGISTVTGKFYTFGHHLENTNPHRMVFYVIMDNGEKYCFKDFDNLDVTQQVHEAPDYRHVHLIIDGFELPEPIENGSGIKPEIDDWEVIEEDVIL